MTIPKGIVLLLGAADLRSPVAAAPPAKAPPRRLRLTLLVPADVLEHQARQRIAATVADVLEEER